jgi:hypothetical protein
MVYNDASRAHAVADVPSCKVESRKLEETIFCTASVCKATQAISTFRLQVKFTAQLCASEAHTIDSAGSGFGGLDRHYADELSAWLRDGE